MPVTKVTTEDMDNMKNYPQTTYMEKIIVKVCNLEPLYYYADNVIG